MTQSLLVADIGGTNARFAIAHPGAGCFTLSHVVVLRAEDYESVEAAAGEFLNSINERPKQACFAAAGPVIADNVVFTNSPWKFNSARLAQALNLAHLKTVNDFEALAAGVSLLAPDAFLEVKPGNSILTAPQLVIGPGTGLGQALIVPSSNGPSVIATEGGHVMFAPQTDEERAIVQFIAGEAARMSTEQLLSGPGIVNIYNALCAMEDIGSNFLDASEITIAARTGQDTIALRTIELFCSLLGRFAGDAVLATGARGGVVLGGGILPKIAEFFLQSGFIAEFSNKSRMSDYVAAAPVKMITNDEAALYGAASLLSSG